MKIIFLDIDGVLNCHNLWDFSQGAFQVHPKLVNNLKHILEKTGAKIVVSSTWRKYKTLTELREFFKPFGVDPKDFIGVTGQAGMSGHRSREISEWLEDHPEVEKYVVLDDDIFDLMNHSEQLVQTNLNGDGLTKERAEEAIKKLL